jgi:hypothetical protein
LFRLDPGRPPNKTLQVTLPAGGLFMGRKVEYLV